MTGVFRVPRHAERKGILLRFFFIGIATFLGFVLFTSAVGFESTQVQAATIGKCDGNTVDPNSGLTATAKHGNVFYIDSGQNQNVDAAYVSYVIKNTTGSAKSGVWAKIDSFTGGVVGLANPTDASMPLGTVPGSNGSSTAFYLLKATSSTSTAQSHILRVYSGKPGLAGSSELYSCSFTFTKVAETIKAAANKVTNITNTTVSTLGSTMTVTVSGATGQIGAGSSIDPKILWFSPAARSSWPTSAYRLTGTSIALKTVGAGNKDAGPFVNTLKISLPELYSASGTTADKYTYVATYTFQIIGPLTTAAKVAPIGQIASGTQIKHTDLSSAGSTIDIAPTTVAPKLTVSKSVGTTSTTVNSTTQFSYTVTLNNTAASAVDVTVDQVTDTPAPELQYVTGTAQFNGATTTTPEKSLSDSTKLIFPGPFFVPAGTSRTITYKMSVATCQTTYVYTNSAVAQVGSISIGSGATTMSGTQASGSCTNNTVTNTPTDVTLPVEATTGVVSNIGLNSATIFGSVDPNGNANTPISFEYGTTSALEKTPISMGSSSSIDPVSINTTLTGLTAGTLYFYRIKAGTVAGTILSFVTTQIVQNPTAATTTVTNLSINSGNSSQIDATFNGSIDNNLFSTGSMVKFEYTRAISGACSGITTTTVVPGSGFIQEDDGNGALVDVLLSGAFPTDVSSGTYVTGLTRDAQYCFRVNAYFSTSFASIANGNWVLFTATVKDPQTISFSGPTNSELTNGSSWTPTATILKTGTSTATGLPITYVSNTPDTCEIRNGQVVALKQGICSLTASQDGNNAYYAAEPVTITFTITAGPPIITNASLVDGTVNTAYSEQLIASDGDGTYSNFVLSSGTTLPPGLNLDSSSGAIWGVPSQAGTYTVKLTVDSRGLTSVEKSLTIRINKKSQTITVQNHHVTYGASSIAAGAQSSSGLGVSFSSGNANVVTVSGNNLMFTGAGTTTVTVSANGNNEYSAAPTVSFTVQVDKAPLNFVAQSYTMTYGDAPRLIYGHTHSGFVNGESEDDLSTPITCSSTYSATTTVTERPAVICSGATSPNYLITNTPGVITVSPKDLTLTATTINSINYGSPAPLISATYDGWVNGQGPAVLTSLPICYSDYTTSSPASSSGLTSQCTSAVSPNYRMNYVAGAVTVTKRPISATAPAVSLNYGDALPAIGRPTYGTFVNGETRSVFDSEPTCEASGYSSTTNVGDVVPVVCSGGTDENYTFAFIDTNITINQRPITVTSDDVTVTYGDPAPSSAQLTYSTTGWANQENETTSGVMTSLTRCTTVYQTTSIVGSNPAIECHGAQARNYRFEYTPGHVVVLQKDLHVTAENKNVTYGDNTPTYTATYAGWVNNESRSALTREPTCSANYSPITSASIAPTINCQGGSATNYNFVFHSGTVNISKKQLNVSAPSFPTLTYGDNVPNLDPFMTGFENGEDGHDLDSSPTCSTTYRPGVGASSSPIDIQCSGGVSLNYRFTYVDGTIIVNKKNLNVSGPTYNLTYGDPIPLMAPIYGDFANGENENDLATRPYCSTDYTSTTPATSTKNVTCDHGVSTNYSFNYSNGQINVAKRLLTITAPNKSVVFGDPSPSLTPDISGWVNAEDTRALSAQPQCVTDYTMSTSTTLSPAISCSGASATNYRFAYISGSFTIAKAPQTLSFIPASVPQLRPGGSYGLRAETSSGRPVTITASGDCTYDAIHEEVIANATIPSDPASCLITASIGSSTNYLAAPSKNLGINISGPAKIVRTLTAALTPTVSTVSVDGSISVDHTLSPNAGTLAFTSLTPGVCTIDVAGNITIVDVGSCSVEVEAIEDAMYTSVHAGPLTFQVTRGNRTLSLTSSTTSTLVGQYATLDTTPSRGNGNVTYIMSSGSNICSISGNRITASTSGVCAVHALISANGRFSSALSNTVTITFNPLFVQPSTPPSPRTPSVSRVLGPANPAPATVSSSPAAITQRVPTPASSTLTLPAPRAEEPKLGVAVAPGAPARTATSVDTVDTGKGVTSSTTDKTSGNDAVRSLEGIKQEALGGFAPGVSTRIEIIGARTSGQFIITPGQIGDPVAIAAAIRESTSRTSTDFATITNANSEPRPAANEILSGPVTRDALDIFAASDLDKPVTVGSLNIDSATSWLKIDAKVATYKPGSVVYLTVTTSPIIFGSAVVGEDGKVAVSGNLPLSLLEEGGHNIRLVGVRELGGVEAGANGEIKLSDNTLNEIKRFDEGSKATIKLVGANQSGGIHEVVREIPLEKVVPWWSLWILMIFAGIALVIRLFARRWTRTGRLVASVLVGIATILPVVLGWITASYELLFFALGLGTLSQITTWSFPSRTLRRR